MVTYIDAMDTTIQVSSTLLERLKKMKMHEKESYEDMIWDLIEDSMELSSETHKGIEASEREIKEGKTVPLSKIKEKLREN